MRYLNSILVAAIAVMFLPGCSKEYSLETGGAGGNPGGGTTLTDYGWEFTGKQTDNYHGCIDTSFYQTIQGIRSLFVEGTDSAGNTFMIVYAPQSGVIAAGSYGVNNGALLTITDQNGSSFLPKPPAPFTLQITRVNDTLVEGRFSGTLTNTMDNTTLVVSNGQFKALIGKENPCGSNTPGGSDADFTLASTGGNCASPFIDGDYFKGVQLDNFNTIELDVDVAVAGDWVVGTVPASGIAFSGFGTFTTTGRQSIVLTASGTPTASGNIVIPIQAGGSSCTFIIRVDTTRTAVQGPGDHFPTTTNSSWVYHVTQISSGLSDSTEVISTGNTKVIGGQTYNVFAGDLFGSVYRKGSGIYYRYGSIDLFDLIDSSFKDQTIFLKDNVPAGSTWESPVKSTTIGQNNINFKRVFTITAKGASLTVKGVVYNDVITVREQLMVQVQGTPYQSVEDTYVSYAKGVGMIKALNDEYELKVEIKRSTVF